MSFNASLEYCVPYADTDQMGVVYYANYLVYFEMARAELLRAAGRSCTRLEKEDGLALPVIESVCRYRSSARFEDRLRLTASVAEVKGARLKIESQVWRGEELLAEGYTMHVCLDMRNGNRPIRIPAFLKDLAV